MRASAGEIQCEAAKIEKLITLWTLGDAMMEARNVAGRVANFLRLLM